MDVSLRRADLATRPAGMIAVGVPERTRKLTGAAQALDRASRGALSALLASGYFKGRALETRAALPQKVKSSITMSVEIQRKLQEILRKRTRDESDFQLRIVVHPTVMDQLRTEDEKLLIELEKRFFGKLSFRADTGMHAEQFKIQNVTTNEELANVGS